MKDYSLNYKRAIAFLAQDLFTSGVLMLVDGNLLFGESLWDDLAKKVPQVLAIARAVEERLNYELSYSQCCNAVNWVYKYKPEDWQELLNAAPEKAND